MRRPLALALLAAASTAAGGRIAAAATFVVATVEEAARSSDAVVRGHVVRKTARLSSGGRIVTEVEIAVDDAWKGAPERVVRVVVPGGVLPGVAMKVDAAPVFAEGEEVVVFVNRRGPAWRVNGLAQGKFHVSGGEAAPSFGGATVLPRAHPATEREVGPMPVEELERRVRAAR